MATSDRECQFTVRCSQDVKTRVDALAERAGQTSAEWVRRALVEKLERDEAGAMPATREELEAIIKEVVLKTLRESKGE